MFAFIQKNCLLKYSLMAAACLALALSHVSDGRAQEESDVQGAQPVPIDYFAILPTMTNVSLSPDGKYLAYRLIPSKNANAVIQILETDNLDAKPFTAGSSRMDIQYFSWIGNDVIWVGMRQQVRDKIEGTNQGVYKDRTVSLHRKGKKWAFKKLPYIDMDLTARLLNKYPNHVLVSTGRLKGTDSDSVRGQAISSLETPDYYLMDIKTHRLKLVARVGSEKEDFYFDEDGDIRLAYGDAESTSETILFTRDKGQSDWREVRRWPALDEKKNIDIIGFDPLDLNKVFVLTNNDENTKAVHLMDLKSGALIERIVHHPGVDFNDGWSSTDPKKADYPAGFAYIENGKRKIAWIDGEEQALFQSLQALFPEKEITISSRSMDGDKMIVFTESGKDPGSYYLFHNGQLQKIGSRNPLLKPEALGNVSFITWKARDGWTIPGYLTTPPRGEPPYPLIVMPHGGPEISEHIVYEEWAQVLANNGYMVLQPGYRGTLGYGSKHATGIYGDWGGKPQDDKDDGALHLVREGLADPDRLAMFGWSYGGYAAMVASLRDPQIYQCTIAGAGVSDLDEANATFRTGRLSRKFVDETRSGGVSPVDHVADVNVPILVIHGENDQRVKLEQSDWFVEQLKKHNKQHRYIVLKDADHFSDTIDYGNATILYTEILNFLKNDCGPGGL